MAWRIRVSGANRVGPRAYFPKNWSESIGLLHHYFRGCSCHREVASKKGYGEPGYSWRNIQHYQSRLGDSGKQCIANEEGSLLRGADMPHFLRSRY